MRALPILSVLLAIGVLFQVALGEAGLVTIWLRDLHATIGLAGVILTAVALRLSRGSKTSTIYLAVLLAAALVQAIVGLSLYGIITIDFRLFSTMQTIHRFNAYFILLTGLVGGVLIGVARRRSATSTQAVPQG
ncbi:MAG: hypothetical protein QXY54_06940 [Nitrososphaerota archaeon]